MRKLKKLLLGLVIIFATSLSLGVVACTGAPGPQGEKGEQGVQGEAGADGIGISNVVINERGELVITYTDGSVDNLGEVKGKNGIDGIDGLNGTDGKDGSNGLNGTNGTNGIGIESLVINDKGEIVITYTDKRVENLGKIPECAHIFSMWIEQKAATCSSNGYNTRECELCGITEYKFIDNIGHAFGESIDMISTCTERWQVKYCEVCGLSQTVKGEPVGHKMLNGSCLICGESDLYKYNGRYGYNYLGTMENGVARQYLYDLIDAEVKNFHSNSNLNADGGIVANINYAQLGLSDEDAVSIWKTYKDDNPLYYWLSNTISYTFSHISLLVDDEFVNGSERAKYNEIVYSAIEHYIVEENSAYELALAYHDKIIEAIDYAYDEDGKPQQQHWAHSILGVLTEQGAVCESYARTFQLLLNVSGVENVLVTGEAGGESHAWNMVKLDDGNWYYFDLTWDDKPDWLWGVTYNYFAVSKNQDVNWLDGSWATKIAYFSDNHTIDLSTDNGIDFLYELPKVSEVKYENDNVLLVRDTFSVGDNDFAVVGYNTVQILDTKCTDKFTIPETVTYKGRVYTTISVGAIKENGEITYSSDMFNQVTEVTIPKSVKFIWDMAFNGRFIKNIWVDQENEYFTSVDGVLFTKYLYTLIQYPIANERTEYTIPDETNYIAYHGFGAGAKLRIKELVFGKNVGYFGIVNWGYGFDYSRNSISYITSVVEALADGAVIVVAEGNLNYSVDKNALYNYDRSILYCLYNKYATAYELPSTVTRLYSEKAPKTDVFNCPLLQSITVEQGNLYFSSLNGILYNKDQTQLICTPYAIKGIPVLSEKLTIIPEYAFYNCSGIEKITIPNGVTTIGDSAFAYLTSITDLFIPASVNVIGRSAFIGCTSLKNINIPEDIKAIEGSTFRNCISLTSIIIPESVTYIGQFAFDNCDSLQEIVLPNNLSKLFQSSFSDCEKLSAITFTNSVKEFEYHVFGYCKNLKTINFIGSMRDWLNIIKDEDWCEDASEFTIVCNDGKLDKNGKEIK